jgi:hypothetical protein
VSLKLKTTDTDKSELIFYSDRGLTVSTDKGTIEIYKNGKITFRDDGGNSVSDDNGKNEIFRHGINALAFKAREALDFGLQKSSDADNTKDTARKFVYADIMNNDCIRNVNDIFKSMNIHGKSDKDDKNIQKIVLEALQKQAQSVKIQSNVLSA